MHRVVREGLIEKVIFKEIEGEEIRYIVIWRKSIVKKKTRTKALGW